MHSLYMWLLVTNPEICKSKGQNDDTADATADCADTYITEGQVTCMSCELADSAVEADIRVCSVRQEQQTYLTAMDLSASPMIGN